MIGFVSWPPLQLMMVAAYECFKHAAVNTNYVAQALREKPTLIYAVK